MTDAKRDGTRILIRFGDGQWEKCSEHAARQYMHDIAEALAKPAHENGTDLRSVRQDQDLTQEQLADMIGISRTYLSEIERGEATNLSLRMARKIASALDCPLETIQVE